MFLNHSVPFKEVLDGKNQKRQGIKQRKVTFSLKNPDANEVFLIGDFNKWNPKTHPMKSDGNGAWVRDVIIPPGEYEYKFMVYG